MRHAETRWGCLWAVIAILALTTGCAVKTGSAGSSGAGVHLQSLEAFPLKASASRRYLVNQDNVPFLIMGDSPQSMVVNLTTSEMTTCIP